MAVHYSYGYFCRMENLLAISSHHINVKITLALRNSHFMQEYICLQEVTTNEITMYVIKTPIMFY